jgi:hypothetical protein
LPAFFFRTGRPGETFFFGASFARRLGISEVRGFELGFFGGGAGFFAVFFGGGAGFFAVFFGGDAGFFATFFFGRICLARAFELGFDAGLCSVRAELGFVFDLGNVRAELGFVSSAFAVNQSGNVAARAGRLVRSLVFRVFGELGFDFGSGAVRVELGFFGVDALVRVFAELGFFLGPY